MNHDFVTFLDLAVPGENYRGGVNSSFTCPLKQGETVAGLIARIVIMSDELNQSVDMSTPVESVPSEKTLRQSEVNEIVGRAKQEAAQKAVENYKKAQQQTNEQASYRDNSPSMSEDRIRQMAGEEAQRLRDQWMSDAQERSNTESAQRIVKNFYDKMQAGVEKYEDFEKATGDLELRRFPNTVQMLAEYVDNSHDVMYELSKNRAKLAQIEMTAEKFPQEALHALNRIAESIKKNDKVSGHRTPNSPLSQLRPTTTGTDSGGELSFKDLKSKYKV